MDRDLLSRALRPLLPELTSFACWLTRARSEADELVHEVVLRALEHAGGIDQPSSIRAWLFRTARNARVDLWRAGAARARLLILEGGVEPAESAAIPTDPLPAIMERVAVEAALRKLSATSRTILLLADLWQFSYEEIASILDVPLGTVRSRIARARAQLAELLVADAGQRVAGGDST